MKQQQVGKKDEVENDGDGTSKIETVYQSDITFTVQKQTQALTSEAEIPSSISSYRPDIDGLRTIAVGIVVIFHAWPESFTGGFIGVDIFFVISGYLITQILVKENTKGTFSYFQFYNRRVKRIYPALIVVLLFVLYLGLRFSEKQHFEMLTRTMAASTIFGANIEILTYKEGYFDASVKTNPLLHLWSLGVEEQFYIFWPFLIALLLTKFNSRSFYLLSAYAIFSFVLNIVAVYINAKFCFYFPFCRFWQMAIGGLLAFKAIKISNQFYTHALSATGLVTILIASFFLSELNLYPGWWAVFPTLASAAIIQSGPDSIVNKHILSNKVMVFFGKVSYSLYLWHWPLLVFSRILYPEGSESILSKPWFIVLLSVMMSILSCFLVENPIRFKKQKSVFVILLLIMLVIGIGSILAHQNSDKIKKDDNFDEQIYEDENVETPQSEQVQNKDTNNQPSKPTNQNTEIKKIDPLKNQTNPSSNNADFTSNQVNQTGKNNKPSPTPDTNNKNQSQTNPSQQQQQQQQKQQQQQQQRQQQQQQQKQRQRLQQLQRQQLQRQLQKRQQQQQQQQQNRQRPSRPKTLRQQYDIDMIPTQQDYYIKNGRRIPNFSKNKKRMATTNQKLGICSQNYKWFDQIFDKKIDASSKYFREKLPNSTMNFEVSNQGQQKMVLLVGDSHAHYTAFRFAKVFEDYKKANRTKQLPTFVSIIFSGTTLIVYEESYKFVTSFIEQFKPDRVFFVYCWVYYRVNHGFEVWDRYKDKANYDDKYFYENVGYFIEVVKNCTKMGIEVTTNTFQPYSNLYNPGTMHDYSGPIPKNLQPVSLTQFTKQYQHLSQHLQSQVTAAGGKIINYTDHLCWEGMCEVVAPAGYCIFYDTNHWNYQAARHWLTSVDVLVEF